MIPLCTPPHTARMNDPPYTTWTNHPPQQPEETPMSVTDMRAQIFANALVIFPHIALSHNLTYPSIPLRAQDIFEVSISLHHKPDPDYIARLTYRQRLAPALHVLLLGGPQRPTAHLALSSLLDTTCTMLGTEQANIIQRPPSLRLGRPVLHGSQEGERTQEMARARAAVTQLREAVRFQTEADVAELKPPPSASDASSRQNTSDASSLHVASLPTTGQAANRQPSPSATTTAWRGRDGSN